MQVLEATRDGTRRHLNEVVAALASDEFKLHIVCAVRRDPTFGEDVEEYRRAGHAVTILQMTRGPHLYYDPGAVRRLRRLLECWPCDVLHLHSAKAGFLGRLAARRSSPCRVIYSPHAFPFLQRVAFPKRWLYRLAERLLARSTDVLLAVSEAEGRLAVETGLFPADRVRVLPNAVDVDKLDREVGPRLRGRATGRTFALVGELRVQKGPFVFLEAIRQLRDRQVPARFVMPERGRDLRAVRRYLRRHRLETLVELLPAEGSLAALYREADFAVLPSLWEGLPYAALDALALRRVVIASRLPVFEDLLGPLDRRLLFPPGNSRALAERMELWAQRPRLELEALVDRGRRMILEHHGMAAWRKALRRIYRSVTETGISANAPGA